MVTEESKSRGYRIKIARETKGLSAPELAGLAGCSDEFLEWVEEGQVEPSVSLLLSLAKALRLDSGFFLKGAGDTDNHSRETSKWTEHYSYNTLTSPEPDSHLMAFSVTIPPETPHEGVGYRHEGEEYVFVLSGKIELTVGEETKTLAGGESLRFNSNNDHHMNNPGKERAELLVILYVP